MKSVRMLEIISVREGRALLRVAPDTLGDVVRNEVIARAVLDAAESGLREGFQPTPLHVSLYFYRGG